MNWATPAAAHRLLVGPRRNGRETASSTARRLHSFHPTRTGNPRPRNKSFLFFFPFLFLFLVTPLPYSDVLLVPVTTRKRNISPNNQRRGLAFPLAASGVVRPFDFCFLARYTSEHSSFFLTGRCQSDGKQNTCLLGRKAVDADRTPQVTRNLQILQHFSPASTREKKNRIRPWGCAAVMADLQNKGIVLPSAPTTSDRSKSAYDSCHPSPTALRLVN